MLKKKGVSNSHIYFAMDGAQACSMAIGLNLDVIFMDNTMPNLVKVKTN
jgi:CheY-like chemotaxis protein